MKNLILIILCACLAAIAASDISNKDESPCSSPLECAIYNDQEEVVKELISKNSEIINTKIDGNLPIHFAAEHNKENMVKIFIDKKPDMIEMKNDIGDTPLILAVENKGSGNLIKYLISKGADVNAKDSIENTALHYCILTENEINTKLLIENNADVNAKDENGFTPLHWSGAFGPVNIVKLLIDNGADLNAKDNNGYTPLHFSAESGNKDTVALLVDNKADVDARNNDGKTPCDLVDNENRDAIWLILKCKA